MPQRLRKLRPVLVPAALGLLTTVAVSWTLACRDIPTRGIESAQVILPKRGSLTWDPMGGPANGIHARIMTAPGRVSAGASCYGPDFSPYIGSAGQSGANFVSRPPDQIIPSPIRELTLPWLSGYPWPRGNDVDWRHVQASGWPMLALASEERLAPNYAHEHRFGIDLGGHRAIGPWGSRGDSRVLPLYPLRAGLAIDTLLYASAWWIAILIPTSLRRYLRHRAHLCPHCAYDRRGLAADSKCPECGTTSSTSPQTRSPVR